MIPILHKDKNINSANLQINFILFAPSSSSYILHKEPRTFIYEKILNFFFLVTLARQVLYHLNPSAKNYSKTKNPTPQNLRFKIFSGGVRKR
jgi:hypothetical protein